MKQILLSVCFTCCLTSLFSQGETQLLATSLTNGTSDFNCISSYSSTTCSPGSTTYSLGAAPTTGTMQNDVWFTFEAPAEWVKLRVCNPSFDAAINVYDASNNLISSTNNVAFSGPPGKEVVCQGGLTYGEDYFVQIGHGSTSGGGTFSFNILHNAVEVSSTSIGSGTDPAGCFQAGDILTRTNTCTGAAAQTRWKVVDESDVESLFTTTGTSITITALGLCMGQTYTVFCEVRAVDGECGNTWYGYSEGTEITMCDAENPDIIFPAPSATVVIDNTTFEGTDLGAGYIYQWRFVTNAGNTDFIGNWSANPVFDPTNLPVYDNFRYNRIYWVYLRAKPCASAPDPDWNSTPYVVMSSPVPYVNPDNGYGCTYQDDDVLIPFHAAQEDYTDYWVRITPLAMPSGTNCYLTAAAPAITSGVWIADEFVDLTAYSSVSPNNMYNVQMLGRIPLTDCIGCIGVDTTISSQQSDFGAPCVIITRTTGSPAVGTILPCTSPYNCN